MGRICTGIISLFLALPVWAEPVISSAPICEGENPDAKPFMKLGLSAFAFHNQVLKVLDSQIPRIEEAVSKVDIQDFTVGKTREACPEYKDRPGFDQESLCLYVPRLALGESIPLRNFGEEISKSVGLRMNFDDIRIPEFGMQDPRMNCRFSEGSATCDISIDIPRFRLETQFDFVNPRENKKILSTASPLIMNIQARDGKMPRIHMTAKLNSNGRANEAIEIDRRSMRFEVPPSTLTSKIGNNIEDAGLRIAEIIESRIDPSLSEEDRALKALEILESDEGTELIERFSKGYAGVYFIQFIQEFFDNKDILATLQEPFLDVVEEPLSLMLTDVIEKVLPFEKSVELTIPFAPIQDELDRDRYLARFQMISDYLDLTETQFSRIRNNRTAKRELRRDHYWKIKNIGTFTERLRSTQLEEVGKELRLLTFRLQTHLQELESMDVLSNSLRKRIQRVINIVSESSRIVIEAEIPLYRKSQLHIEKVGRVSADGLEVLVSGCHVGGLSPNAPDGWDDVPMNKSVLSDNDFSVEIPTSVVNQHLSLLQENGFYNYCSGGKEKTCAEKSGPSRTVYKFRRSPRIKSEDGRYYFEFPEIQRTSYTFLPNFLDKAFLRDSTKIKVCLDGLVVRPDGESIIPEDCIDANAKFGKSFSPAHLLSFIIPPLGLSVMGLKLTHIALQEMILDNLENGLLSNRADDLLLRSSQYSVHELRVENDRLSIFGKINTKSELQ